MMKQKLFLLFALLLGTFVPHSVLGYSFSAVAPTGQTLYYTITNSSTNTVSVVPQNSSSPYYSSTYPSGVLEIPASVTNNGTTYSVTGIGGQAFYDCSDLTGTLTIPNSVTSIGRRAFYGCTGLTGVTIPNSVTSIGQYAFRSCSGLTGTLTIPNSVTSIDSYAFYNCTSLTSVTIPNSVTWIGDGAFLGCTGLTTINYNARNCSGNGFLHDLPGWLSGCTALTTVNIGNSVKKIPHCAFYNCTGLTNVTIGNSVTSIGDSAFYGCTGLTDTLTIPNSVASIGQYAFYGCTGMTSVTIGNSVTSIGNYAFYDCTGLTGSLTIPNSVTSIGNDAFSDCTGLTTMNYNAVNCQSVSSSWLWGCAALTTLNIGNSVEIIPNGAFYGCTGLTSVTIGNSVTSIGQYAFYGCTGLTSVIIPNTVTNIEYNTFRLVNNVVYNGSLSGCPWGGKNCNGYIEDSLIYSDATKTTVTGFVSGLTVANIPNSVTSIRNYAFYNCTGLTSVTIPNSVTFIGEYAFYNCTSLTSVTIPNSVSSVGDRAFYGCTGLTSVTIPNSVTRIGDDAFFGCTGLTSVTIPNSVTSIGIQAFYNCSSLTSVTIPNSVTSIGIQAFYNCSSLTSVTIPNSVTSIGAYTFSGCTGLTSATIPNSVTSIRESAFSGCTGLTSVTIPNSVTSIGDYAFQNCTGLTTINYNAVNCQGVSSSQHWLSGCTALTTVNIGNLVDSIPDYLFSNCTRLTTINYHAVNCQRLGTSWRSGCTALTTVTIGDSVEIIPNNVFRGCSGLTGPLTIPNSVTSIGYGAFYGCTGLTSVTIPNSVTSIEAWAFGNCSGLTSVTIGNSVTSLNLGTFQGCTGLTSVTLGNSVTSIGQQAFYGCIGLTSVTIPNSVTSIGGFAFGNCSGLTNITIPDSVTSIWGSAFCHCTGLTGTLTIPNSVTAIGRNAFDSCINLQNVILPNNLSRIDTSLFRYCTGLTSITIPNSVTSIHNWAFIHCSGLTNITIPDSVTSIGEAAFQNCTGLTTINYNATNCSGDGFTIANGSSSWLRGCSSLTRVNVGNNVRSIPENAFYNCTSLHVLDLGSGLTSVGANAFYNCDHLDSIYSRSTTPPTVANTNAFENVWKGLPLTVPTGSRSAYAVAYAWRDFTNIVEMSAAQFTVIVNVNDASMGTVTGGGTYAQGATATLSATANTGFRFVQWNDGNTQNPRTVTVTADATYMAFFAANQYTVAVYTNDSTMGTVTGGGSYAYGTTATLNATPNTGYTFTRWQDGNTDNPRTVTVSADATYIAFFAADQYTVTVFTNDSTMGTVTGGGTYAQGATATLTATPNTGYTFTQWQDGNTDNPRTVTVTTDATYTAYFAADQSNAPQIAYVGVDSNGHNAVSWTPQAGTSPVRYNVYREGIQAGVYELVGVVNASGATSYSWTDDQSNPATRAYSYRLAEVAADNTESDLSIPHTTIHLQISQGQGDAWNLAWTPYVGFNYSTYNLYRGTDASSMTLLTTLPATATTYSDLNTGGTAYYYQIEVVQLGGAKTTAVSSRSNIVTTDPDPQTYTLTVLSADVLRGTVTGGGSYTEGTMATLTAEANEGYVFLQWQDGSTANPRNILVTANGTYMAYFTQTEGIADAEGSNVTITARNGRIQVSGAEGRQVTLSDALGRILYCGTATESLTVEAPATGIYLLQVEGHPAHRISVVR